MKHHVWPDDDDIPTVVDVPEQTSTCETCGVSYVVAPMRVPKPARWCADCRRTHNQQIAWERSHRCQRCGFVPPNPNRVRGNDV